MAYFSEYYSTLKELKDKIIDDINGLSDEEKKDDRLVASMLNFSKEVEQLAGAASINSAIENKASLLPENTTTHWWAGSGEEP